MRILRVFPKQTFFTPSDKMVWIGSPFRQLEFDFAEMRVLEIPQHDEVHISCVFSWDKTLCLKLQSEWMSVTPKPVRVGGPAFNSPATDFTQGLYIKSEVTFTSRGCNNNCPWCIVPNLEGKLNELSICAGSIIQDNNFLQTNKAHQRKVFEMLKTQRGICFKGGLQTDLITPAIADEFAGLRIKELWLAADTDGSLTHLKKAVEVLKSRGFNRNKIYCYSLIGLNADAPGEMERNEARCCEIYEAGAMPFAQLYQPIGTEKKKAYSSDWRQFHRMWCRPAATTAHMEKGTNFREFST